MLRMVTTGKQKLLRCSKLTDTAARHWLSHHCATLGQKAFGSSSHRTLAPSAERVDLRPPAGKASVCVCTEGRMSTLAREDMEEGFAAHAVEGRLGAATRDARHTHIRILLPVHRYGLLCGLLSLTLWGRLEATFVKVCPAHTYVVFILRSTQQVTPLVATQELQLGVASSPRPSSAGSPRSRGTLLLFRSTQLVGLLCLGRESLPRRPASFNLSRRANSATLHASLSWRAKVAAPA